MKYYQVEKPRKLIMNKNQLSRFRLQSYPQYHVLHEEPL